ncbi:MAG: hypothetical protein ACI9B8_000276 [Sulfitobacter sp.]|jgi:hypothetical protein
MKIVSAYIVAVLVTYIVGALAISQGNVGQIVEMGFDVTVAQRLDAALHDVTHMYDLYLPLVSVGLLIGLLFAGIIIRFVPHLMMIGYVSAGFTSMLALPLLANVVLGAAALAPTREISGLIAQGVAGGIGGYAYFHVTNSFIKSPSTPKSTTA